MMLLKKVIKVLKNSDHILDTPIFFQILNVHIFNVFSMTVASG